MSNDVHVHDQTYLNSYNDDFYKDVENGLLVITTGYAHGCNYITTYIHHTWSLYPSKKPILVLPMKLYLCLLVEGCDEISQPLGCGKLSVKLCFIREMLLI